VVLRKATGRGKSRTSKLKLKKENLRDLDSHGKRVKGGATPTVAACWGFKATAQCLGTGKC
jgi:hypothetical protein